MQGKVQQKAEGGLEPPSFDSLSSRNLLRQNRCLDGLDIVVDHVDIGRGRTIGGGKRVGIERAANLKASFAGDLVDQSLVGDVFDEDRRCLVVFDLIHELGDIGSRSFGFR